MYNVNVKSKKKIKDNKMCVLIKLYVFLVEFVKKRKNNMFICGKHTI